MLLRIVTSLDTQLFVSIHIRNNLFQHLINVGKLGAEFLIDFVDQLRQRCRFFFRLWLSRMNFVRQRLALFQSYRTFENFPNSVILQCDFIIQEHLSTTLTFRQLFLQKLGIGVEFMEVCIIQMDNICQERIGTDKLSQGRFEFFLLIFFQCFVPIRSGVEEAIEDSKVHIALFFARLEKYLCKRFNLTCPVDAEFIQLKF